MARGVRKREARRSIPAGTVLPGGGVRISTVTAPENPLRAGMPALDTIHSRISVVSPRTPGRAYTILRTTEIDSYETAARAAGGLPLAKPLGAVPTGDAFKGTARKAAKLSIANASVEKFNDLKSLIATLPPDSAMASLHPPIKTTATSNRVSKEKRNVRVKTFLYAASRENDNDFHLIVGRDPAKFPEMYMTMELSGLPPQAAQSHSKLRIAREAYKTFFAADLPGMTYDFYDPPIPVEIQGSLFFDMSHATGQRPGPQSLKSRMPTVWEVHPISEIVLEP